jgi:hypothetical protein
LRQNKQPARAHTAAARGQFSTRFFNARTHNSAGANGKSNAAGHNRFKFAYNVAIVEPGDGGLDEN